MQLDEFLKKGQRVRVTESFRDFDGDLVKAGSEWTFESYSYFVYDGGYTFTFKEGVMRMAEISPNDYQVFLNAERYFELIPE